MLTKTLKFIRYELLYSGHIQALGAAGIVYATAVIAGLKITVGMFVVPYLLFQSIYYFDRYWGLRTDVATNEQRTLHLRQFGLLLPILVIFLLLVTMFLLFLFATDMAVFLASTIAIFGFLYPIFFKNITRYVPLFKNYYVAFVFASLVFFPFIYRGAIEKIGVSEAVLFLFVFVETMLMQIVLDMKDITGDSIIKLRTLPIMWGEKNTIRFLYGVSLAVVLLLAIYIFWVGALFSLIPLIAGSFIVNIYSIWNIAHHRKGGIVAESAKFLLWPLLIIFR